jgi:hypothetical protein
MPMQNLFRRSILYLPTLKKKTMKEVQMTKEGQAILINHVCPFRNPVMLPSPTIAGQIILENIPCSSACILFEFRKIHGQIGEVTIDCGNKEKTFSVGIINHSNLTL